MNKKLLKQTIISVPFFVMLIFVSILLCSTTLSWMSKNRKVNSSGMKITMNEPDGVEVESFQIYKRNGATNSADLYIDTSSPLYNKDEVVRFEMTEYDTVFTDRNVNTPVILRVELNNIRTDSSNNPLPIKVDLSCLDEEYTEEKLITYKDSSTGEIKQTTKTVLKSWLSNILYIQCSTIVSSTVEGQTINMDSLDINDDANSIYEGVINYFSTKEKSTFLTIKNNSYEKENSMNFVIEDYDINSEGKVLIYFEFNYSVDNVDVYIDEHLINVEDSSSTGATDIISFDFDLSNLKFTYTEGDND